MDGAVRLGGRGGEKKSEISYRFLAQPNVMFNRV